MRFLSVPVCAFIAGLAPAVTQAADYDILATVFQFAPPAEDDPAADLSGVIRIDPDTGEATPFIPENFATGDFFLSGVEVGPHDGLIYVSSVASGTVNRYDSSGAFLGNYASFQVSGQADGVNRMTFADDGTLFVSTASGVVAEIDPSGTRQADVATGLVFPTGLALSPSGDLYVATGNVGAGSGGSVLRLDEGGPTTIIAAGDGIGGGSGLTYRAAVGDYNGDQVTNDDDLADWATAYGSSDLSADGNGDGVVDAADYTLWRNNRGDEAQLLVADLDQSSDGNEIYAHGLVSDVGGTLTTIPVDLPDPLPVGGVPTNVPSEVLVTPEGTLLVSTLGPTQRPENYAAVLEFSFDGELIQRIDNQPAPQTGLPPLSGIALLPTTSEAVAVPEPAALALVGLALLAANRGRD